MFKRLLLTYLALFLASMAFADGQGEPALHGAITSEDYSEEAAFEAALFSDEAEFLLEEGVFIPAPELTSCLRRRDQQQAGLFLSSLVDLLRNIEFPPFTGSIAYYSDFTPFFKEIFGYLFLLTPF